MWDIQNFCVSLQKIKISCQKFTDKQFVAAFGIKFVEDFIYKPIKTKDENSL